MPPSAETTGFLGFHVDVWTFVGLTGTFLFASRFYVQWLASERKKASVIPVAFWWLSLGGSVLQAVYFTHRWEIVGMASFYPNLIIYIRNLQLIRKQRLAREAPPGTNT